MKKLSLYLIFLIALFVFLSNCATNKLDLHTRDYDLFGTWVNADYDDEQVSSKIVYYPNGSLDLFIVSSGTEADVEGEFIITDKWGDQKGNVWYTVVWRRNTIDVRLTDISWFYGLCKISNSGKTIEMVVAPQDYPKELDPETTSGAQRYFLYNRQ